MAPPVSTQKSVSSVVIDANAPLPPPPVVPPNDTNGSPQIVVESQSPDLLDPEEFDRRKKNFDLMHRNSSAIAKEVLTEYEDDDEQEITTDPAVWSSSTAAQRQEFKRLEAEIKRVQIKNAQLVETLQIIRLKGEMERIELENA